MAGDGPPPPDTPPPEPTRAWRLSSLLSPGRDARDLRALYYRHFGDRRKERQLFSTGAFFLTFGAVRGITHAIRAERGPFRNITPGAAHPPHDLRDHRPADGRLPVDARDRGQRGTQLIACHGWRVWSGAALTLDEFALWLNLADDYWTKQGRESIDAVALFGSLLVLSVLGGGFFRELLHPGRDGQHGDREIRVGGTG